MIVVKTFQQLKQAMNENEQKIKIVGGQAPEILAAISKSAFNEGDKPMCSFLSRLHESFAMLEIVENNQKVVTGILHQKHGSTVIADDAVRSKR